MLLFDVSAMDQVLAVEPEEWRTQLPQLREHYAKFGHELPAELRAQLKQLEQRLDS